MTIMIIIYVLKDVKSTVSMVIDTYCNTNYKNSGHNREITSLCKGKMNH